MKSEVLMESIWIMPCKWHCQACRLTIILMKAVLFQPPYTPYCLSNFCHPNNMTVSLNSSPQKQVWKFNNKQKLTKFLSFLCAPNPQTIYQKSFVAMWQNFSHPKNLYRSEKKENLIFGMKKNCFNWII